jgi:hypothetical protein
MAHYDVEDKIAYWLAIATMYVMFPFLMTWHEIKWRWNNLAYALLLPAIALQIAYWAAITYWLAGGR